MNAREVISLCFGKPTLIAAIISVRAYNGYPDIPRISLIFYLLMDDMSFNVCMYRGWHQLVLNILLVRLIWNFISLLRLKWPKLITVYNYWVWEADDWWRFGRREGRFVLLKSHGWEIFKRHAWEIGNWCLLQMGPPPPPQQPQLEINTKIFSTQQSRLKIVFCGLH